MPLTWAPKLNRTYTRTSAKAVLPDVYCQIRFPYVFVCMVTPREISLFTLPFFMFHGSLHTFIVLHPISFIPKA